MVVFCCFNVHGKTFVLVVGALAVALLGLIDTGAGTPPFAVRLVDSARNGSGRVEVRYNGTWGTVCDDYWSRHDAEVVCRMLGWPADGALALHSAAFGRGKGPILMDRVKCDGPETSLDTCSFSGWGFHQCNDHHTEDAGVICFPDTKPTIEVRLVNGYNASHVGRVEVKYSGIWGTVCRDGWGVPDATVVCRMLGLPSEGAVPLPAAMSEPGAGPIFLDDVACVGTEVTLADCDFPGFAVHNCHHNNDVAVWCRAEGNFSDLKVRLAGSNYSTAGRVEVQYDGVWGTVCDDRWSNEDAKVVCRMLNLPFDDAQALVKAAFGSGVGPILMDNVDCQGTENSLANCSFSDVTSVDCSHTEDAAVICADKTHKVEVRLADGNHSHVGRVEVQYYGIWGTICDDHWSNIDAKVVCRMLGLPFGRALGFPKATFGPGSGPILLSDVDCDGTERTLTQCRFRGWFRHYCTHKEDASVICADSLTVDSVRLAGGNDSNSGRVEVQYLGVWGTICDNKWSSADAIVVCRMLGLPFAGARALRRSKFGQGTGPILMNEVECMGTEDTLANCTFTDAANCDHYRDASVICTGSGPQMEARLVGGANNGSGRVEVNYNGTWGTVCDDHWSSEDAAVVCRMLGLPSEGALAFGSAAFGPGSLPVLLDDVHCEGAESTLAQCAWTADSDCFNTEDASVLCAPDTAPEVRVRLANGSNNYSGRVEVYYHGLWGTVSSCGRTWSPASAAVVCRMLGLPSSGAVTVAAGVLEPGSGPVLMSDVGCSGAETTLANCTFPGWGIDKCPWRRNPASVSCNSGHTRAKVRLTGSSFPYSGRLEVNYVGIWGSVCDDDFDQNDAEVICRQLNYSTGFVRHFPTGITDTNDIPSVIWLDQVNCSGHEANIDQCHHRGWGVHNCGHSEDISVSCQENNVVMVRLTGKSGVPYAGRLEINYYGIWGTVCDDGFRDNDAAVICRQLNYSTAEATAKGRAFHGEGSGKIWLDSVNCTGNETSIDKCHHDGLGTHNCNHAEDVSVICSDCGEPPEAGANAARGPFPHTGFQSAINYTCSDGYRMKDGSRFSEIKCPENGTWPDIPVCHSMVAQSPRNVSLTNVSSRSMEISWTLPNAILGDLLGTSIQVRTEDCVCLEEYLQKCSDCRERFPYLEGASPCGHLVVGDIPSAGLKRPQTYLVDELLPGVLYTVLATAVNTNGRGHGATESQRTLEEAPSPPSDVRVAMVSTTSVRVAWNMRGPRPGNTTFTVRIEPLTPPATARVVTVNGFDERSVLVEGLEESWHYMATVTAATAVGSAVVEEPVGFSTPQGVPGAVRDLAVIPATGDDVKRLVTRWRGPGLLDRNGNITHYTCLHNATGNDIVIRIPAEEDTRVVYNVTIGVIPDEFYKFEVRAVNRLGEKGVPLVTVIQAPSGAPPDPLEGSGIPVIRSSEGTTPSSIRLRIRGAFFNQTDNGRIHSRGLVVCEVELCHAEGLNISNPSEFLSMDNWRRAVLQGFTAYRATPADWLETQNTGSSRSNVSMDSELTFTIGDAQCSQSSSDFCNGPLAAATEYSVLAVACTRSACLVSSLYGPFKTKGEVAEGQASYEKPAAANAGLIVWAVFATVAAVVAIAVIAYLIWRKRQAESSEAHVLSSFEKIETGPDVSVLRAEF